MRSAMFKSTLTVALGASLLVGAGTAGAASYKIGTIGDSYTAEYRYNNGSRSNHRNWVGQLAIGSDTGNQSMDFGSIINTTVPRYKGFEQNWALSGATTDDAIRNQVGGVAGHAASLDLDFVVINIGVNNFHGLYGADAATRANEVNSIVTHIQSMVDQIQAANSSTKIIVSNIIDQTLWPSKTGDPSISNSDLAAVRSSIQDANAMIKSLASSEHIGMIDAFSLLGDVADESFAFAGLELDRTTEKGDRYEAANALWADDSHAGSIYQGIYANVVLTALQKEYGVDDLTMLTNQDIFDAAWRRNGQNAPIADANYAFNYGKYVVTAPTPTVFSMGLVGMGLVMARRRRKAAA